MAVEDLTAALRRRTAERDELKARLEQAERPGSCLRHRSANWSRNWVGCQPCSVRLPGGTRRGVREPGLRLDYDPHLRQVKATADLSRVAGCVRGGLGHVRHELRSSS
ncbi:integrase domain protein [Mycobacterium xenopi 4042]|uniref:Integrase domain protein n=1 Tax=Mycobacterium xenopi 4042 TaxID=1299334 RepID=X8CJ25_MYCXE|nr:integrase domain protein [Mycobacterium xenopi 4042]